MKNLLSSKVYGGEAFSSLLEILADSRNKESANILRGAVFFLGMSQWGRDRVESLRWSPLTILPTFLTAISYGHSQVAYEILLSINRVTRKYSNKLSIEWDIIIEIVRRVKNFLVDQKNTVNSSFEQAMKNTMKSLRIASTSPFFQGFSSFFILLFFYSFILLLFFYFIILFYYSFILFFYFFILLLVFYSFIFLFFLFFYFFIFHFSFLLLLYFYYSIILLFLLFYYSFILFLLI